MTAKELLDILNDKYEVPAPELADLCFSYTDESGKSIYLKLTDIRAFDVSTDLVFLFEEDKHFPIVKEFIATKYSLRESEDEG